MKKQRGRPLDGILLLNKPLGLSSNQALQTVKKIYFAQKAGHTGSLDPLATGMLPICFGEATKFSQFLLDADKEYETTAQFGIITTTADAEGEVVERYSVADLTKDKVLAILPQFRGETTQVPSMYSALKHQGKALYEWAREGITIEREARPIHIKKLELTAFDDEKKTANFIVQCSKGTYIRNLVEDIGRALGCGAYVSQLHRTSVGNLPLDMLTLPQLEAWRSEQAFAPLDACILPLDVLAKNIPKWILTPWQANQLLNGQVPAECSLPATPLVALYNEKQAFLGLAEIDNSGTVTVKRLINQSMLTPRAEKICE